MAPLPNSEVKSRYVDPAELFPGRLILAPREQIPAHSGLADLRQPLGPMAGGIDLVAGTRDGPTMHWGFP